MLEAVFRRLLEDTRRRDAPATRCAGWCLLPQLLAASWLALASLAMAQDTKNVLILYGNNPQAQWIKNFEASLRSTTMGAVSQRVEFYTEFFDLARFPTEKHAAAFINLMRERYADRKIDVVVSGGSTAFEFLASRRKSVFPDSPLVYPILPPGRIETPPLSAGIVGVSVDLSSLPAIELALRLHPGAKRLVLVTGAGSWDIGWETRLRRETASLLGRVELEFLARRPAAEVFARLSALPKDALVFTPGFYNDGAGADFQPADAVAAMAAKSAVPLYVSYETLFGTGATGGVLATFGAIGHETGEMVAALLNGKQPAELNLPRVVTAAPIVDWRQIHRWGIDERLLPPNAVVMFREPSMWDQHWRAISTGIVIVVLQTALIVALLYAHRVRRRATVELEESAQRMTLVADAASLGIWIRDLVQNKIWASDQWRTLFGIATSEPLEFNLLLQRVHPDDREAVARTLASASAGGGRYEIDFRVVLPDGEVRWIGSRGRVEFNRGGVPALLRGVSIDITRHKRAELELQQQRNELAHLARVMTLSELSGSLAHELNQPLAIILTNAQAAQRLLAQQLPDIAEARDILADIVSEDERAGEVIKRLRMLLKPGQTLLQPLSANALTEDVLRIARSDLIERGIKVHADLNGNVPPVVGDRVQLQQVLLNLILNAGDAMAGNPPPDRHLTIRTTFRDGTVRVSVSDTGCGLPLDPERVFEPFYTTKKEGLGLGLSICRSIVSVHNGRLWAEPNASASIPSAVAATGRGTTVWVELPAAAEGAS